MQFENDILISYAPIDDQPLIEGEKGWVSEFHRSLQLRLAQLLGDEPAIWRNNGLAGNDVPEDEIMQQLPNVALLVSIFSPPYIKSEWCNKELHEFYQAAKQNIGERIKNKSRIFKVLKMPVEQEAIPDIVRDTLGYQFFRIDEQGRPREFSKIFGDDVQEAYWQRLDDLAYDICSLLREMKEELEKGASIVAPELATRNETIYLAQTTHELQTYYDKVKRELQHYGYQILPETHLPYVSAELEKAVEGHMKDVNLSIHLFGGQYGMVPEGTEKSIGEIQHEQAIKSNIRRLIWLAPKAQGNDQRQENFLKQLTHDASLQQNAEFIRDNIDSFILAMHDTLKRKEAETDPASNVVDTGPQKVYLICDQPDIDAVLDLEDYLFDQGLEVIPSLFDGDEQALRTYHQDNLKICDASLIYYGNTNELWVRSKLSDWMKIAGYGRSKPLLHKAVFLAGPTGPRKARFRSNDAVVINGIEGFQPELVNDFLKSLKGGQPA